MRLTACLLSKIKMGEISKQFANLPDSYIKRSMEQVYWKTPRGKPQYLPRTVERKKYRFTTNRPWTTQFLMQNMPGTLRKKVFVEPVKDWSFFRGDRVEVLVGPDKGKQGIVKEIIQERNWVIVEGLNTHIRRVASTETFPGVTVRSECPLLVTTDVSLVDPGDLKSCPVEWRYTESGERVRVSCRTGRVIPIPVLNKETHDYKLPSVYKESPKDTTEAELTKITFEPQLKTFEMDLMDKMGIKEDRIPKKTYWY